MIVQVISTGFFGKLLLTKPLGGLANFFVFIGSQIAYLLILVSIYILTGFFDRNLTLLFFVVLIISGILFLITTLAMGGVYNLLKKTMWISVGSHLRLIKYFFLGINILLFVSYPIVVGYVYFTSIHGSVTAIFPLIQVFVAYEVVTRLLRRVPTLDFLSSKFIDPNARTFYFITTTVDLIPLLLFISLTIWIFGWAENGIRLTFSGFSFKIFPWAIVTVVLINTIASILPHYAGTWRAKKYRLELIEEQRKFLTEVANILSLPSALTYIAKLNAMLGKVRDHVIKLVDSDEVLKNGMAIDGGLTFPEIKDNVPLDTKDPTDDAWARLSEVIVGELSTVMKSYQKEDALAFFQMTEDEFRTHRDKDVRFQHLDWLRELYGEILTVTVYLSKQKEVEKIEAKASRWSIRFSQEMSAAIAEGQSEQAKQKAYQCSHQFRSNHCSRYDSHRSYLLHFANYENFPLISTI